MDVPQNHNRIDDFDLIVRQHRNEVMRQAREILRDFHRAEDVTQEAFLEAIFSLHRLQNPQAIGAWLRTITRHRCYRVLRSRDLELLPPEEFVHTRFDETSPSDSAAATETRGALVGLLQTLPRELRDAAMLFYIRQCSQREAAAFLGIPITTLNNRLHSARAILKQRMMHMPTKTQQPDGPLADFSSNIGTIIDVRGPIIDARFDEHVPDIFDALAAADAQGNAAERMKVAQRLDGGVVRCIATGKTDALRPGTSVINSGEVGIGLTPWVGVTPVADEDIERAVNMLAEPRPSTNRLLETGIKPIDLFCPLVAGGTMALLGIQGIGRIVLVEELVHRLSRDADGLRIFYFVEPSEPDSVRGMLTEEKEYAGDVVGTIQTWWMLSEKAVDPDAAGAMELFDALVFCTPMLGIQGLFPAIDGLMSRSQLMEESIVGREHIETAARARDILRRARGLMTDPVLLEHLACRAKKKAWERAKEFPPLRMAELGEADRLLVSRARKLERFLTTPFFVAEKFNHRRGKHVSREQTVRGCRAILDGEFDGLPEESFVYIGEIAEARGR